MATAAPARSRKAATGTTVPVEHAEDVTTMAPARPRKAAPAPKAPASAPVPMGHAEDVTTMAPARSRKAAPAPKAAAGATVPVEHAEDVTTMAPARPRKAAPAPKAAAVPPVPVGHGEDMTTMVGAAPGIPHMASTMAMTPPQQAVPVESNNETASASGCDQQDAEEVSVGSDEPLPIGYGIGNNREFTITDYIGKGGFGHTYLVENGGIMHVAKECAPCGHSYRGCDMGIYPIPGHEADCWTIRNYFANEVRILNKVSGHDTRIVHLVARFKLNETQYYVMAHLPGGSLEEHWKQKKHFTEEELQKILEDLLGALEALQNAGVIHRDIKPKNIMRTKSDDNVLIDFGNACELSEVEDAIPARSKLWAPPEEFAKNFQTAIGTHTDIFELGATIYFLITGEYFNPPELCQIYKDCERNPRTKVGELEKIAAPYLEKNREKIMGLSDYSIGFRKALCKALEPCVRKRLSTAKEWIKLISSEVRQAEEHKEKLRTLEAAILSNPGEIDKKTIEKLLRLLKHLPAAALPLAKCYHHLWQKDLKNDNKESAEKNCQLYESYLKKAAEDNVKGADKEYADHIMLKQLGNMTPHTLARGIELYTKAGETRRAENCKMVVTVMNQYQKIATLAGFTGMHNFYLHARHHHGAIALLPEGMDNEISAQQRGIAQLLCLILSCGLCLPLLWVMAWLEQKKISRFISPAHLSKAHH